MIKIVLFLRFIPDVTSLRRALFIKYGNKYQIRIFHGDLHGAIYYARENRDAMLITNHWDFYYYRDQQARHNGEVFVYTRGHHQNEWEKFVEEISRKLP